jgi:hypothetical protein
LIISKEVLDDVSNRAKSSDDLQVDAWLMKAPKIKLIDDRR